MEGRVLYLEDKGSAKLQRGKKIKKVKIKKRRNGEKRKRKKNVPQFKARVVVHLLARKLPS